MKSTSVYAGVLLVVACGCTLNSGELPPDERDVSTYISEVHPVLEATCATLDCHGEPNRPLRLYSEIGLRASADLRGSALTLAEQEANVTSLLGVDSPGTAVDQRLVLTKPLSTTGGGVAHVGTDLWTSTADPGYRCLRAWLAGSGIEETGPPCATALESVQLPP